VDESPDDRYLVVDGRRWRRSDPSIPPTLHQELVDELMDARRAVKAGKGDDDAVAAARERVDAAKRALGERGRAWWERPTAAERDRRLQATVLALARHRAPKTICPSDVARSAGGASWRGLMDDTRQVVRQLAVDGRVEVLQKGETIDPTSGWKGPVRIRLVS
jgi:hypothetical protein